MKLVRQLFFLAFPCILSLARTQGAPEITEHPESKTVINGSNVTFSCNASGYSTVSWTKNGSFLRTNANSRISFGRLNKTLTIRNVISEDSGQYRCVVFNGSTNASSDAATLNVLYKPVFTSHPRTQTVKEGDSVSLSCNAIGNPEPSFSWTIDGSNFNKTVHRRVSLSSDGRQLTVTNVSRTDSDHEFRCQANNTVGMVASNAARLNVQCEYQGCNYFIAYVPFTRFCSNQIK
ncbi:leucine-rich repeats and immunoglobulin-like domains protein 3 isoform X2 [Montipora capricornis]|uniref:leucine-rich repeats and immunoglobulin-like domains protein 3 isoform X2 n=1 Tax=Montipora capricornis TaxID=246305 RepID=UPI0035F1E760